MITILLIANILVAIINLFVFRYNWFFITYYSYIVCVNHYLSKNPQITAEEQRMYYQTWPLFSQILPRMFNWRLREFMVYPELFDAVLEHASKNILNETDKN